LILVANEADVASRSERIAGFLRATRRGYLDAIADPAAALAALQAASPELDVEVETEGLQLLIPVWTDAHGQFGTQTAGQWQDYAAWMAENGLIPADLDVASAWAGELAIQATPAA
jgi:ABC-type nitrate/sulfonate/bicarbonate transport system substrate-binding protein